MRKIQNNIFSIDPLITIIFLILVFIGFISIFSTQIQDDVVFFSFNNEAFKQLIWIIFSFVIFCATSFNGMCDVTLAVQKLSTTLNSQQNSFMSNFSCINSCSSLYLQPPSIKLVLFIGPKLMA